jgi:hypothetical protein
MRFQFAMKYTYQIEFLYVYNSLFSGDVNMDG